MKLFTWGSKWVYVAIGAFLLVFFGGMYASCAHAKAPPPAVDWELSAGQAMKGHRPVGEAVHATMIVRDQWGEWDFGVGGLNRQVIRDRRDVDAFWYISASRRVYFRHDRRVQPFIGLGVMVLPDGANWRLPIPISFHLHTGLLDTKTGWFVQWRHGSNAGLDDSNPGQDLWQVGKRF